MNIQYDKLLDAAHSLYQTILYLQQIGYNKTVVDDLIGKREVMLTEAWQIIKDTEG